PLAHDAGGLLEARQTIAAEEGRVEALERVRVDDAGQRDARVAALGQHLDPLAVPRRHPPQRLRGGESYARALHVRVEVRAVDDQGGAPVRGVGDRTGELLLAGGCTDGRDLPGLDVGAVDREVGEGVEAVVHGRQAIVAADRTRCGD